MGHGIIRRFDTVLFRLFLLAGVPIALIGVVAGFVYNLNILPSLYTEAEEKITHTSDAEVVVVAAWIREHREKLQYIATTPAAINQEWDVLLPDSQRMKAVFGDFVAIVFADTEGQVVLDTNHGLGGGYVGDRDYFREARAGQSIMGDLIRGRPDDRYVLMVAEPIRGDNQQIRGVVFAPVLPDSLETVIGRFQPDPEMSTYLIDSQNFIVSGSGLGEQIQLSTVSRVREVSRYTNREGVEVLGYRNFIPGTRWTIVTEMSYAAVARSIDRYNRLLAAAAFVALLFAVGTAAILAGTIQIPIHRLDHIARLVGENNFDSALAVPHMRRAPRELKRLQRILLDTAGLVELRRRELEQSKDLLEETQSMARLGSWEYNPAAHRFRCSRETFRILGEVPQIDGCQVDGILSYVHSDDHPALKRTFFHSIRSGEKNFEIDHRIIRADNGEERVVHQRCIHTRDTTGKLLRTRGMIHDITDRYRIEESLREALADKSVLLQEVHHRVRNNLAIIESLLTLKLTQLPERSDAWQAIAESHSRIASIALVHDQLYQNDAVAEIEMSVYVSQLVESIRHSYSTGGDIRTVTEIAPVHLDMTRSIPCGLIINELVVNSFKHAFPSARGTITVRLTRSGENDLRLTVADDGIGIPGVFDTEPDRRTAVAQVADGLGVEIVKQLTRQIGGKLSVTANHGTEVSIVFTP